MRLIIAFFFLCIFSVHAYPRASCLKANDICNTTLDFAVDDYILCGEQPAQDYPVDPNILAPKGSGYMRHPDDCDGVCVDIMSEADKDNLVCGNAVLTDLADCTRFKNAKQCVADTGGILWMVLIVLVVLTLCVCCFVYNPHREKDCPDTTEPDAPKMWRRTKGAYGSGKMRL